jgi:hypothetical protein
MIELSLRAVYVNSTFPIIHQSWQRRCINDRLTSSLTTLHRLPTIATQAHGYQQ